MTPTPTGERKCDCHLHENQVCDICQGDGRDASKERRCCGFCNHIEVGKPLTCKDSNCKCHHPIPAREGFDKALESLLFDYGNICVKADGGDEVAKTQEGIKIGEIKALINTNRSTLLSQLEAGLEKLPQGEGLPGALDVIRSYRK